jgi:4-hydroxy-3-polyprenylbenzoate decarboxylase
MAAYYRDFRDYLASLEERGLLVRVHEPIDKDTELHPLVRLQFRGRSEPDRRAFLFEQVRDARGRAFDLPVAIGCMAASRQIYAAGMKCDAVEDIPVKWAAAQASTIAPVLVDRGPCQEVVIIGPALEQGQGLDALPIPISTPGFDNAPYLTAGHFVTRHPETGLRNVGNYRAQLKSPTRLGCLAAFYQDLSKHWVAWQQRREPMPVAIVIGTTPNVSYTSVSKIPSDLEEYAVAGGVAGAPVELVRCQTVPLEVPANAEIVIEGWMPTDELEMEGPFGEFTGYMASRGPNKFVNVTAITRRREPIYVAFLSQFPPSESSILRGVAHEHNVKNFLAVDQGLRGIKAVALHEATGSWGLCVIQVDRTEGAEPGRLLEVLAQHPRLVSKVVVVIDDDIPIRDANAINWAISFRSQPHRDFQIVPATQLSLDPSLVAVEERGIAQFERLKASALLIDATRKWAYPPLSLPAREYMERARARWDELGLGPLQLNEPWHGYSLGAWPAEVQEESTLAVQGRYADVGARAAAGRYKIPRLADREQ